MSHRSRNGAIDREKSSRASRPTSAPPRGRAVQSDKLRQPQLAEQHLQEDKPRHHNSHHDSERDHRYHRKSNNHNRSHHGSRLQEVTELQKSFHNSHRGHISSPLHGATAGQEVRPTTASGDRTRRSHGQSRSMTLGARGEHSARSSGSRCSSGGGAILSSARVVPQAGDGSCLFHSLSHGLGKGDACSLRREICNYIAKHPDVQIADAPLKHWIKHDSGCDTVKSYASNMKSDSCWGGGIEMAAFAKMKGVNVHVYEKCPKGFQRISAFDIPKAQKTVKVLYHGRSHYDALES
eukprot:gnl/MRDRNA2_/MRDRNA2_101133_c0_seq1.p1 gnl/MRDRNA2_/MRDRNA2_101133_c0~~gnl/MRDRNA2_/MRDRNA2_101133_c0_seq1.p1  ORF type:complete len:294 (-),score=27.99 gnl/MRDRNA2_/MRDRNA2_101133_c0_seq1:131-1012(-)